MSSSKRRPVDEVAAFRRLSSRGLKSEGKVGVSQRWLESRLDVLPAVDSRRVRHQERRIERIVARKLDHVLFGDVSDPGSLHGLSRL